MDQLQIPLPPAPKIDATSAFSSAICDPALVDSELRAVVVAYHQRVPVRCLVYPPLSLDKQERLLCLTHASSLSIRFPPHRAYTRSFLKSIIAAADCQNCEACEELLTAYVALTINPGSDVLNPYADITTACPSYTSYPLRGGWLTLREEQATISKGTTGLTTWEAALRFGEYLVHHAREPRAEDGVMPRLDIRGKQVLELGAGTGFLGIVAALLGAASVRLTDVDPDVLTRLVENVEINFPKDGATAIPTVAALDWEAPDKPDILDAEILICSDVGYDPVILEPLVGALVAFLSGGRNGGRQAWVALTRRREGTFEKFMASVLAAKLTVRDAPIAKKGHVPNLFFQETGCGEVVLMLLTMKLQ